MGTTGSQAEMADPDEEEIDPGSKEQ